jgi:hypothetical protein
MEKQDLYIKEALNILRHNNLYFKKVYAASKIETYQLIINGNEFYFTVDLPEEEDDRDRKIFESHIQNIPNVSNLMSNPGQLRPSGARQIEDIAAIYNLEDDFEKIVNTIKSLAAASSPEPEPTPEPDTTETEKPAEKPAEKNFFIHKFTVTNRTKDASPQTLVTSVTDRSLENYQLLLEYYGYIVSDSDTIKTDTNPQNLYEYVPNDAITPKTIKPAPGAIPKSYYIRISWGTPENRKVLTFHSVSTYWDKSSVDKLFNEKFTNKLNEKQKELLIDLKIDVQESEDKSRFGTFDFNKVGPAMLVEGSKGLAEPQAYDVVCYDSEGEKHSFTTVKSTIPIDEYVYKLRLSGFNNITSNPVKKAGNVSVDDITADFSALTKKPNLFQKILRRK